MNAKKSCFVTIRNFMHCWWNPRFSNKRKKENGQLERVFKKISICCFEITSVLSVKPFLLLCLMHLFQKMNLFYRRKNAWITVRTRSFLWALTVIHCLWLSGLLLGTLSSFLRRKSISSTFSARPTQFSQIFRTGKIPIICCSIIPKISPSCI